MKAIVMNPLGLILTAIALVVGGLVSVFKTFQPLVDKVEQSFAALGAVLNVIKNAAFSVLKCSFLGINRRSIFRECV